MFLLYVLIQTVVSAFLNRVRGGWIGNLPFGATVARWIWAVGTSIPFVTMTFSLDVFSWWLVGLPVALWLGTIMGWQGSLDLGRNEHTYWRDFAVMTARGLLWTMPSALFLSWVFWSSVAWWVSWPLFVTGAACALLYELAWHMPKTWRSPFAAGPEMGEWFFGAAMGLALALVLMFVVVV